MKNFLSRTFFARVSGPQYLILVTVLGAVGVWQAVFNFSTVTTTFAHNPQLIPGTLLLAFVFVWLSVVVLTGRLNENDSYQVVAWYYLLSSVLAMMGFWSLTNQDQHAFLSVINLILAGYFLVVSALRVLFMAVINDHGQRRLRLRLGPLYDRRPRSSRLMLVAVVLSILVVGLLALLGYSPYAVLSLGVLYAGVMIRLFDLPPER